MINQAVFRSVVLGLQSSEESLLGSENLNGGTGALCKVHERSGMGDKPSAYQFSDKRSKIGCKSLHASGKIVRETSTMLRQIHDLLG